MRRLFIIRKDLHLSAGKLAAMVGHCAEAYWTRMISDNVIGEVFQGTGNGQQFMKPENKYKVSFDIDKDVFEDYIHGTFTKTVCEAKNLNHLLKVRALTEELSLTENTDFGFIHDKCLTELKPENEDGTCTVGVWFKPLNEDIAHKISKKYQLYKD